MYGRIFVGKLIIDKNDLFLFLSVCVYLYSKCMCLCSTLYLLEINKNIIRIFSIENKEVQKYKIKRYQ